MDKKDETKNLDINLNSGIPFKDIYQDLLQPSVQQIGQLSALGFRVLNVLTAPINYWVTIREDETQVKISNAISKKFESCPPKDIVPPETYIAIPALQALSYSFDSEELRNLYANLLAKAMQIDYKCDIHPAFVEVIKQLSPLDAKIISTFANRPLQPLLECCGVERKESNMKIFPPFPRKSLTLLSDIFIHDELDIEIEHSATSISNLSRLGIIEIERKSYILHLDNEYLKMEQNIALQQKIESICKNYKKDSYEIKYNRGRATLTNFGKLFVKVCVSD